MNPHPDFEKFLVDRRKAFEIFTEESIRSLCLKYSLNIPSDEKVFWLGAHKARSNMTDIDLKYVYESVKWLMKRGHTTDLCLETVGRLREAGYELPLAS